MNLHSHVEVTIFHRTFAAPFKSALKPSPVPRKYSPSSLAWCWNRRLYHRWLECSHRKGNPPILLTTYSGWEYSWLRRLFRYCIPLNSLQLREWKGISLLDFRFGVEGNFLHAFQSTPEIQTLCKGLDIFLPVSIRQDIGNSSFSKLIRKRLSNCSIARHPARSVSAVLLPVWPDMLPI